MPTIKSLEYFRVKPRWLFLKIEDERGNYGWGEATLEGHTRAVEGTLEDMRERILGDDADDIEYVWQKVHRRGFYRGGPVFMSALSGIDIALWDLKARRLGVPVWQLLGGRVRHKVKVYAWIGGDNPSDVEGAARARREQGYKYCKMNATGAVDWLDSPSELLPTLDRLKAVNKQGLRAGLDFHGRLHVPMAKQLVEMLAQLPAEERPLFVEEPLLSEHPEALARLNQQSPIPIALGERLYSRWDVKPFLQSGAVDVLQPDLSHAGGISEVKRIASMAEAYDVAVAPHCPLGPIALAASMAIAASTQNFVIQEMSRGIHYNTEAGTEELETYLTPSCRDAFKVNEGFVSIMSKPGLGVDIDEAVVRRISADAHPWPLQGFDGPDGAIREW
ncbi:MAG: hypothetical protein Q9159_001297 [Coniocarpon cinnabarinum]